MLTLISPAKTLDWSDPAIDLHSLPSFQKETFELVSLMKKKSVEDIKALMDISHDLAVLNKRRYLDFQKRFDFDTSKQALLAFHGDVYTQIEVGTYTKEDYEFAQDHLRILSGLYGLLRPMDLIQPYRLEMGIRLENKKGKNLYEFWGSHIAKAINESANNQPIVNLASQEYFKAVDTKKLKSPVVTPIFLEYRNGKYETIGLFAKKARGKMVNYIIKNRIEDPQLLKGFEEAGYEYAGDDPNEIWRFVR